MRGRRVAPPAKHTSWLRSRAKRPECRVSGPLTYGEPRAATDPYGKLSIRVGSCLSGLSRCPAAICPRIDARGSSPERQRPALAAGAGDARLVYADTGLKREEWPRDEAGENREKSRALYPHGTSASDNRSRWLALPTVIVPAKPGNRNAYNIARGVRLSMADSVSGQNAHSEGSTVLGFSYGEHTTRRKAASEAGCSDIRKFDVCLHVGGLAGVRANGENPLG